MTRLSGQQNQALTWVAYRTGAKPSKRALKQLEEMGLATAPRPGHDVHWRLTQDGGQLLRRSGLADLTTNVQQRSLPPRPRVA